VGPVVGTMVFAWNPRALWLACGGCAVAGSLLLIPGTRRRERDAAAGSGPAAD